MACSFRLIKQEDAIFRTIVLNSAAVSPWIFIDLPVSVDRTSEWITNVSKNPSRGDFAFEVDGKVIGFGGLVEIAPKHGRAELYVFLAAEYHGCGYGKECVRLLLAYAKLELGLRKISLFVSEGNQAAIHLYEKVGFRLEGTLCSHSWHRGRFVDRMMYSIFLDDFDADYLYRAIK